MLRLRFTRFSRRLAGILLLATASVAASAQQPLTNESVIRMTKAGLGDSLIVQAINATPGSFSTSTSDLITLKQAGVSERVIGAMIAKHSAPPSPDVPEGIPASAGAASGATPAPDTAATSLEGVDEMGVYYKNREGKWTLMEPELVNFRSGGALKSYATNGLIKQDKNGHLMGPTAKLALTKPATFLLYMPAGTAPVEFLLLKLRPGGNKGREFRSETGGVFHSSSGAQRDEIPFDATKIAPRIYQFTLPAEAGKGEYGILPPGSISSSNAGSAGKIFTFKILE